MAPSVRELSAKLTEGVKCSDKEKILYVYKRTLSRKLEKESFLNRVDQYAITTPPSLAYIEESAEVGVMTISPMAGHFSRIISRTCRARSGQLQ